jgi:glycosyltransferase involved in cell wall biosynthesis
MQSMVRLAPDHEFVCFGDRRAFAAWTPTAPNVRCVEVAVRHSPTLAARVDGNRSPSDMLRLSRAVWKTPVDVFFSPSVYSYFPLPPGVRSVVTVHDAIPERFPQLTLPSRRARLFWKMKVGLAIWQARLVLTVSEYSRRDIARVLGVPSNRIRVAVEAPSADYRPSDPADSAAAATRAGIPAGTPWFIYVGGFNPHKRVDTVIRAHAELARGRAVPPRLLLVGKATGEAFYGADAKLRALIAELGTESIVTWTGYVPDDELRHLVSGAVASLLPSECEGFGLPAVEAAACGTPVIATIESPLPELLDGGGVFVAPGDVRAVVDGMRRLLDDPAERRQMSEQARECASRLTWEACGRSTLTALTEAAA